jgi:hypothetical protein
MITLARPQPQKQPQLQVSKPKTMDGKCLIRDGERGRNRTYNLLIKSTCEMKNQQSSAFVDTFAFASKNEGFSIYQIESNS